MSYPSFCVYFCTLVHLDVFHVRASLISSFLRDDRLLLLCHPVTQRSAPNFWNIPVRWNVDLGDFEVQVSHSSHGDAVTSCGEVEELLL